MRLEIRTSVGVPGGLGRTSKESLIFELADVVNWSFNRPLRSQRRVISICLACDIL